MPALRLRRSSLLSALDVLSRIPLKTKWRDYGISKKAKVTLFFELELLWVSFHCL